ncbi:YbjN domain-containing protein [Saliniramus sp.]|uniref:YbjN domain-containing protein n=1 Tax=Saliniramus sp. TaxID=2986772 RepID=UPI0039C9935A
MTMTPLLLHEDRAEHPLDEVERLAANEHWVFERFDADEMCVSVSGQWADYQIAFTWIPEVEALHIACAFDLKVQERRRTELLHLVSMINEQLWVGHFDLWGAEQVAMYRHALLLTGGTMPARAQCEMLMKSAIDACERHYQAFQFVLWAGKSAREALDSVLFETEGEA